MAGGERSPASATSSHRKRKAAATDDGGAREDVITLLRAAIEFKHRTGAAPTPTTMSSFYRNVEDKLRSPLPEQKIYNKFRTLRHHLNQAAASGRVGGDDDLVLKLSEELWFPLDKEKKDKKGRKGDEKENKGQKNLAKEEEMKRRKKEEEAKKKKVDQVANKEVDSDTDMEDGEEDAEDQKAMKDIEMDEDGKKKSHPKVPSQEDNDTDTDDDDDDGQEEKEEKKLEKEEDEHNDEDDSGEDEEVDEEEDVDEKGKAENKYRVNGGKLQPPGDEVCDMKKENNSKVKELKEGKDRVASSGTHPYVSNVAEEYWKNHGLWSGVLKEAWKSIDCSKANALEEKLKKHFHEELRLQADWGKLNREILESLIQTHKSM